VADNSGTDMSAKTKLIRPSLFGEADAPATVPLASRLISCTTAKCFECYALSTGLKQRASPALVPPLIDVEPALNRSISPRAARTGQWK
jgi:hypothetical protein